MLLSLECLIASCLGFDDIWGKEMWGKRLASINNNLTLRTGCDKSPEEVGQMGQDAKTAGLEDRWKNPLSASFVL